MSSNPFENEPGHEGTSLKEDKEAQDYASKVNLSCPTTSRFANTSQIQHETLRITVIQRLERLLQIHDKDKPFEEDKPSRPSPSAYTEDEDEPLSEINLDDDADDAQFEPFGDLYKQRFLWYYDAYAMTIAKAAEGVKNGKSFPVTPFEFYNNQMAGKYAYKTLSTRLRRIRKALDDERDAWSIQGLQAVKEERGIATNLARQFEQHSTFFSQSTFPVELALVDDNPFVWNLTFFGKAETDLYGATINVRIHFSPNFPREQPRVNVLTPLFHHRISKTGGVLCYFPTKPENVRNHIEAIMASIEEEQPAHDPRTLVNPDAAVLLWGKEDQKKVYRRKLRRSVQDSMENIDEF